MCSRLYSGRPSMAGAGAAGLHCQLGDRPTSRSARTEFFAVLRAANASVQRRGRHRFA
ncbi:hypothetical protein MBT84_01490 [Streptomyces sp. MBT84]|nr:hypothetical protein [Streptomyces sp. MBT84]